MLVGMTERGPDSAGLAVFASQASPLTRISLFGPAQVPDWSAVLADIAAELPGAPSVTDQQRHAVLLTSTDGTAVRALLAARHPQIAVLSVGNRIDLYKDIGSPAQIAERYRFDLLSGSHAVGHTRMATESAVTPAHAHPFTAGRDFCLVHNGSLSNPYRVRRKLEPSASTSRPTEPHPRRAGFSSGRMREGDPVDRAIERGSRNWTASSRS